MFPLSLFRRPSLFLFPCVDVFCCGRLPVTFVQPRLRDVVSRWRSHQGQAIFFSTTVHCSRVCRGCCFVLTGGTTCCGSQEMECSRNASRLARGHQGPTPADRSREGQGQSSGVAHAFVGARPRLSTRWGFRQSSSQSGRDNPWKRALEWRRSWRPSTCSPRGVQSVPVCCWV